MRICLPLLVIGLVCQSATARPPEIRNLNLRGLQIGATTVVAVDGADLLPSPKLYLDDRAIDATVDPQSTPTRAILSVPLSESTSPGIGQLRVATVEGVSNSVLVGLDRFPQMSLADEVASTPIALHGAVPGSGVSRTTFNGKAGEDIIVEVEARRIGSKLRPVLHVYDSRRIQVAWAMPSTTLCGDARVMMKLPRDERYTVELHDTQYAPPGPSFFRLKLGRWQFADLAFPPAVARGQEASLELLGNLPGSRVPLRVDDGELVPLAWPGGAPVSGLPPTVAVSTLPELLEAATTDRPMTLPGVPVAVSGRLNAPDQRDRFLLPVTAGTKLVLEVFAERIGSRIDAVLEVRNQQGAVLASNDDAPNTTDSRLEYAVPAGVEAVEIVLRDALNVASDEALYRLIITSADAPQRQFDVVVKSDVVNVASGEMQVLETFVQRRGYDGPIQLQLAGLPAGMTTLGTEIPAGANGSLLGFMNVGDGAAQVITRVRAQAPDGSLVKPVRVETTADDRNPAWLREHLALSSTPKSASPFQVAWANEAVPSQIVLASKTSIPLKLVRPASTFGPVRVLLVTSQPAPKVNGQPNPNQAVRLERPIEVPIDNAVKAAGDALAAIDKQHADAVKQSQVAQGDAKTAADAKVQELAQKKTEAEAALRETESKANYQTELSLVVPSTLTESSCDVSVRAELLNLERNVVLRTAYAPIKRLNVLNPLSIKLAGPAAVETTLDPKAGATVKYMANIERLAEYKGDVNVAVTGLPAGVSAANAAVKADQSEFAIELKIPVNFAATEIKGIKLTATGPPDPLSGNIPVKSADVELSVKLNKPAP